MSPYSVRAWVTAIGLLFTVVLTLSFQNCSRFGALKLNAISGSSYCTGNTADPICTSSITPTCSFNGTSMTNGASVTAYLTSTVATGSACQSQTRTCTGGTLSGSYAYANCSVGGAAACLFNGATIADGSSVTAYLNSMDTTCQAQTRTCANGVLSGSYAYGACTSNSASQTQSCLFNGQTIAHGQSVSAFTASQVAFGLTCTPITRTCYNGALSGSGDYASCTVAAAASCLFNGGTVASGSSVTGYAASTVPYGQACSAQTRTCANGALSGTGDYASCTVNAAASCLINGQTIADGSSITLYLASSVGAGQSCTTETRTCANGSLSGSATATSCSPAAVLCGADVVNNPNVDAAASLQACLNTSAPLIELVPGRYFLSTQLTFSNRSNVTVQTQGVTGGIGCLNTGAAACAILTANQAHAGPTILDSYYGNNITFSHIAIDGNIAVRRALHTTNDWPGGFAYNARVHSCGTCSFIGFASVRAPQGTGLEFDGDNATFDNALFRDNGWGMINETGVAAWADGLTIWSSANVHITNSTFKDNSDIDLILGNGPGAVIQSNWIGNTYNFSYGALMLDNFNGGMPGNFAGAVISNNTVDCGQGYCGLGINIGPHMWYASAQVIGGSVYSNTVSGARQGILTNGATGWDVYGNTVNVLGIYTNGTYSTNFISYTNGDSVNIHDNSTVAQPSGLVGMPPQLLASLYSNFNGTSAPVSQAFREVLGRDPDLSGGPAYTTAMAGGMTLTQVRTQLAMSQECANMINSLYLRVFQRGVDAGGLTNWQNYLISGGTIPQLWVQLELSPEGLLNWPL